MTKKQSDKPPTKTEFLRSVFINKPGICIADMNQKWTKAGFPGAISSQMFYMVRRNMGIRIVWEWSHATPPEPPVTGLIYQLKITLKDTKPPIWRRIQVTDCTLNRVAGKWDWLPKRSDGACPTFPQVHLEQLHYHIQSAFGWKNSHLHEFVINNEHYTTSFFRHPVGDDESLEVTEYRISQLISDPFPTTKKPIWSYIYDFGDDWRHDILVEKLLPPNHEVKYPICVAGARACPPEDCGGPWGYAAWLGGEVDDDDELLEAFDAEAFDPVQATVKMRR